MKTKWSFCGKGSEKKIESLDKGTLKILNLLNKPYSDMNFACTAVKYGLVPYNDDDLNLFIIRDEVDKNPKMYNHPSVAYLKSFYYGVQGAVELYKLETVICAVVLKEAPTKKIMCDVLQTYPFLNNGFIAFYFQGKTTEWYLTKQDISGKLKIIQASQYNARNSWDTDWIGVQGTNDHIKYLLTPMLKEREYNELFLRSYDDSDLAGLMFRFESQTDGEQVIACEIRRFDYTSIDPKFKYLKEFKILFKDKPISFFSVELVGNPTMEERKIIALQVLRVDHNFILSMYEENVANWYVAQLDENGSVKITLASDFGRAWV